TRSHDPQCGAGGKNPDHDNRARRSSQRERDSLAAEKQSAGAQYAGIPRGKERRRPGLNIQRSTSNGSSSSMKLTALCVATIFALTTTYMAQTPTPTRSANEVAVIKTSEGDMVVQFWTDAAPNTIENFKQLARSGFYDGTIFHRIIKEFMIQGGDPNSKDPAKEDSYGEGGPDYNIKAEFNDHPHQRGVLSMARGPDPDSAGSQFFICLAPVHRLDHQYKTSVKLIK